MATPLQPGPALLTSKAVIQRSAATKNLLSWAPATSLITEQAVIQRSAATKNLLLARLTIQLRSKTWVILSAAAALVPKDLLYADPLSHFHQRKTVIQRSAATKNLLSPRPAINLPRESGTRVSRSEAGVTLVELIITVAILSILASAAVPITRFEHKREKERELRYDLWTMRAAIDKYKDAADRQAFQTKVDSQNYPPDLETLVKGVDVQGKKVKFLRKIPTDPMTGKDEWGERSMQDDADSTSFGGQNLFDIYSKSEGTALDGTKYSTW